MPTFLLEIGTEELPADFARLAIPQLQQLVEAELELHRLDFGKLHCTSTPRRLAVLVEELQLQGKQQSLERKGPPGSQALSAGKPTEAALGFARRCGVSAESLEIRETAKGPFVFATVLEAGSSCVDVLTKAIPTWINALQGKRFMRWGNGEERFSRPLRWLVAMMDADLLEVKLTNTDPTIVSSCFSRGHRLARAEIKITSGLLYSDQLRAEGVIVDREERAKLIGDSINIAAAKLEAKPDLPKELFEELIDLVEAPLMITGAVPKHYLDLPAEVLCTVMRVHQRYVPLYARNTVVDPLSLSAREYLLPKFLCITNSLPEAVEQVQRGNERVLEARLADAQFFLTADQAITSEERRSQLSRVSFAAGLGNLLDRTERLEWCVIELIKMNGEISKIEAEQIIRAAHYCKHDLVSQMVSEFPELQGIMGAKYLLAEGESRATALAVLEHYLPRGAGDVLPQSKEGNILAIAERLELLLSIYAKGDRPSGSSDPYALRRAGNALLLLLWDMNWSLNLWELLQNACEHWFHLLPDLKINSNGLAIELAEFLQQRFLSLLQEQGCDPDIAQAVAGLTNESKRILNDVTDGQMRVKLLTELRRNGSLQEVQVVVQRAAKLAEKAKLSPLTIRPDEVIDIKLFEKTSEHDMYKVLKQLEAVCNKGSNAYVELADILANSSNALANFFDGDQSVMVMVEDLDIRNNRLNMLGILKNQAYILADFSCLNATFDSPSR